MTKQFTVSGTTYVQATGPSLEDAVRAWVAQAGGGYPDYWEAGDVDGTITAGCEGCERPILDSEEYAYDPEDGIYLCSDCAKDLPDEEPASVESPSDGLTPQSDGAPTPTDVGSLPLPESAREAVAR